MSIDIRKQARRLRTGTSFTKHNAREGGRCVLVAGENDGPI
jgi:hypothetical protein